MISAFMAVAIQKEADINHDRNLTNLLEKCNEHDLRLSARKIQFKSSSVAFMGHRLTNKGVQPDPSKVAAITGMPTPAAKAAVQRFLAMWQYLSKLCQNLSQTVLPLRDLTRDDTEFLWSVVNEVAFNSTKTIIASTTALLYYDVSLPATLQVDASDSAIGGVLLQEGHPICFTPHTLSATDRSQKPLSMRIQFPPSNVSKWRTTNKISPRI